MGQHKVFKEIERTILTNGFLTPKQAAIYLGLSHKSLADYRSRGRKPDYIKRGQTVRYPAQAIIEFIKDRNEVKYMKQYDHLLQATTGHGKQ